MTTQPRPHLVILVAPLFCLILSGAAPATGPGFIAKATTLQKMLELNGPGNHAQKPRGCPTVAFQAAELTGVVDAEVVADQL